MQWNMDKHAPESHKATGSVEGLLGWESDVYFHQHGWSLGRNLSFELSRIFEKSKQKTYGLIFLKFPLLSITHVLYLVLSLLLYSTVTKNIIFFMGRFLKYCFWYNFCARKFIRALNGYKIVKLQNSVYMNFLSRFNKIFKTSFICTKKFNGILPVKRIALKIAKFIMLFPPLPENCPLLYLRKLSAKKLLIMNPVSGKNASK